jgi:hypothetical protein
MVTGLEPLDGSVGALVSSEIVCCCATTMTVAVPDTEPEVAVRVMLVPAARPDPDKVAVIVPAVPVVAPDIADRVPLLADNVTATPLSALLFASFASTVIVAELLPSVGIVAALLVMVNEAGTVEVGPVVPVPHEDVLPPPVPPVKLPQPLSPPQPASASSAMADKTNIEASLRMFPYLKLDVEPALRRINTR